MIPTPIGWDTQCVSWELKAGNSGQRRVALTVTKPDGTPLDSYDGWTAKLALSRSSSSPPALTMVPTVTADVPTHRLLVDLDFSTAITSDIAPGTLVGDLALLDPDGERHYALNVMLTIDRSYAALVSP